MTGHIDESLRRELQESALTDQQIEQLHYRSVTADQAHLLTGHRYAGWVVPITGPDGKPFTTGKSMPFYRLKPSKPVQIKPGEKPARYLSPAGEGCRPYFSTLFDWSGLAASNRDRDVTEGEKKGDSGCAHRIPTIALSGVDGWRDHRSGQTAPLPELNDWLTGQVRIAWDSDIVDKPNVLNASLELSNEIARQGGHPLITFIPPQLDGTKNGVDDFIGRHGAHAYGVLRDLARPAGEVIYDNGEPVGVKWSWHHEPGGPEATHTKALTAWTVFKDEMTVRPLGLYCWTGTHWQRQDGKPAEGIAAALHTWMDHARWRRRTGAAFGSVASELSSRLKSPAGVMWDPPHLLAFSNGTLNTRANTFTPGHRREDRLTSCLPYPYDTSATCPTWRAFLESATGNDPALIKVLRAAMRWTIEPKNGAGEHPVEYYFDLEGPKGSGKGTVLKGVETLVGGDDHVGVLKSASFSNTNALLGLLGKRASIDYDASGFIADSGVLNSIVTNEQVEVKALYVNTTQARLNTVIWRAMNDRPGQAAAGAEGSDRRCVPLPFDHPPRAKDPYLKQKIAAEAAGIFQWVWKLSLDQAFHDLHHASDSDRIKEKRVEAAKGRNTVLEFFCDTYEEKGTPEVDATTLFGMFQTWRVEKGYRQDHTSLTSHKFGKKLKELCEASDPALRQPPVLDQFGRGFSKGRVTGPVSTGRVSYSIPQMSSWDVAAFLQPGQADGDQPEQSFRSFSDPSGRDPLAPLHPEPSEPSEPFREKVIKEGIERTPLPPSYPFGGVCSEKGSEGSGPSVPSSARDLKPEGSEGLPKTFRNELQDPPSTPSEHANTPSPVLTPAEQAANAARSNLTTYRPGDQVFIAHQRLRHGQLHQATVSRVTNASVSFTPPFPPEALLQDPTDPDQGHLQLPQPLASASTADCTPQLGTASAANVTRGDDGSVTFTYTHSSGDTITRTISPARIRLGDLAELAGTEPPADAAA
jgi:P4 family phage/plasmid primase-like protien